MRSSIVIDSRVDRCCSANGRMALPIIGSTFCFWRIGNTNVTANLFCIVVLRVCTYYFYFYFLLVLHFVCACQITKNKKNKNKNPKFIRSLLLFCLLPPPLTFPPPTLLAHLFMFVVAPHCYRYWFLLSIWVQIVSLALSVAPSTPTLYLFLFVFVSLSCAWLWAPLSLSLSLSPNPNTNNIPEWSWNIYAKRNNYNSNTNNLLLRRR